MATTKVRTHNEWFRTVSLGNRKSCPCCRAKLAPGESVWSWGEYIRARWNTVKYFCRECFVREVRKPLIDHAGGCGCKIDLVGYYSTLPDWLTLKVESAWCGSRNVIDPNVKPGYRVRDRECLDCKRKWTSEVVLSEVSAAISGERSEQCGECGSRNVMSSPVHTTFERPL